MTPYLVAAGITIGAILCGIGIAWLLGHPPVPEGHWTDSTDLRFTVGEAIPIDSSPSLSREQKVILALSLVGDEVEREVFPPPADYLALVGASDRYAVGEIGYEISNMRTFKTDMHRFLDRIVKHGR